MKRLAKALSITVLLVVAGFGANYALDTVSHKTEIVSVQSGNEDGDPQKKKCKTKCCKGKKSCKKGEEASGCRGSSSCKKEAAGS